MTRCVWLSGVVSTLVASGSGLYGPWGILVDTFGFVFVADFSNRVVRVVSSTGKLSSQNVWCLQLLLFDFFIVRLGVQVW